MIKQKNNRDCLICCLSELLNIEYDSIPKFYELYPDDLKEEGEDFTKAFDEWLLSKGYYRILIDIEVVKNNDGLKIKSPYISLDKTRVLGVLKKEYRDFSHCVVLDYYKNKVELNDPKLHSDYDLSDLIQIEILAKV